MKHLYLIPHGGLCNRLRAIASARRVASLLNCKLSVIWAWGRWSDLFESCPDIEIFTNRESVPGGIPVHRTLLHKHGGDVLNQKLNPGVDTAALETCHHFSIKGLPPVSILELREWFVRPSADIESRVTQERAKLGQEVVGVHIRRTDHAVSTRESPNELFLAEISMIAAKGLPVYLATDNSATREYFWSSFPATIRTMRLRRETGRRWPVKHRITSDLQDDFLDFLVLSNCSWVLGSYFSSFSGTAMALNGDPRCRYVVHPPPTGAGAPLSESSS